jgi:hypothetical protein
MVNWAFSKNEKNSRTRIVPSWSRADITALP